MSLLGEVAHSLRHTIQKKLLGQVQPDDYAKAAMEVVDKLRQAGITPSEIWLDDGRLLITLIQ